MAFTCAVFTAYVIQSTLDAFSNSRAMAMIIVDGGSNFVSDDAALGRQLSDATKALKVSVEVSYAVAVSCLIVTACLTWRCLRK